MTPINETAQPVNAANKLRTETAKRDGRSLSGQIRYFLALAVTRRGTMKGAK